MATRLLNKPTLFRHLHHLRRPLSTLDSSATATAAAAAPQIITTTTTLQPQPPQEPNLDLTDHERIFSTLPTLHLLRSFAVLHAAGIGPMIDIGTWVMSSRLMHVPLARDVVLGVVKRSFYEHFCAGEDASAAAERVRQMHEATGLRGMLFYGVEHADDGGACDNNLRRFVETVEAAKSLPSSYLSSVVVKITAICPMSLLIRVSDLLRWQYKDPSLHLPWKLNTFPIFAESSPLYHTSTKPDPLTLQEEQELQVAHERLLDICQRCQEYNIPLVIDAEDTIVQPGIDYFTYSSAIMYNRRGHHPIVYNTMQCYLKDARERLYLAARTAEQAGIPMGFKLVRGAYMSSESKLAASLGCNSPIHDSIEETHACYNDCLSFLLENVADGLGTAAILATHNVDSGKLAAKKAGELGIEKGNNGVEFAQLYGMSDALSRGLRNAGFNVGKYMPFGPVDMAIPYLLRRAEENRGMLATSTLDKDLMRKELIRRFKAAAAV